jgi:diaminopimelate epimerase
MEKIPFMKMNGCGNDFIVIDNRGNRMNSVQVAPFVQRVCSRRISLGADGVLFLEESSVSDFSMRYFNADGSEGEMCGNGARCIAKFAYTLGVAGKSMSFETRDGIYEAVIEGVNIKVKFPSVRIDEVLLHQQGRFADREVEYHYANVGVPHAVVLQPNLPAWKESDVLALGRAMRYASEVFPNGTNVNLIEPVDRQTIRIRTYERGVEDETLACGSGSTASAIIASLLGKTRPPVNLHTRGGVLQIDFQIGPEHIDEIYLAGEAKIVAEGHLLPDAWR